MRNLFAMFLLVSSLAVRVYAQDSMPPEAVGHSNEGGYRGRTEVFLSGFGLLSNNVSSNSVVEQTDHTGGVSAGYRFHLTGSSALEGRYGFSRNTQTYSTGGSAFSIPAYFSEISGSYVYSFANAHRVRPFLEGGGGAVVFSPANYGGSAASSTLGYGVNGGASTGSSIGLARQLRGMFVYGAGADMPASSHLNVRFEFRSLGYNTPDFGTALIHTNTFSFAYEPSVALRIDSDLRPVSRALARDTHSTKTGTPEVQMKGTDPATVLAERAIRQWQIRGSNAELQDLTKKTEVIPAQVGERGGISTLTVGSVAGFLGAIVCLIWNIAGALVLGVEPLRLLRIYATILQGRRAFDISAAGFFIAAFAVHVVTGILFGMIFALGARRFHAPLSRYISAGAGYGIAIWLMNFYAVLSWLQPLLHGSAFIITEIPIPIAGLTHVSYGLTVALVTYVLQRDCESIHSNHRRHL